MQVGIDSFAAAFDENSRAVNPADRLRQLDGYTRIWVRVTRDCPASC